MPPATTNEHDQPIRLTLLLAGRMQRIELTGTVWGAHDRPARAGLTATLRCGRVKHAGREYAVVWNAADQRWTHVETPPQYDENETGE